MKKLIKTKKGVSEIIAYVLLIVISLALASGVFIFLKKVTPANREICAEEISLYVKNYSCDSSEKTISLAIENKGFFSVKGFFIKGSNDASKLPVEMLTQYDPLTKQGRYDFKEGDFLPGAIETMTFRYQDGSKELSIIPLKKIQIQPYTQGNKTKTLLLCDKGIINLELQGCE